MMRTALRLDYRTKYWRLEGGYKFLPNKRRSHACGVIYSGGKAKEVALAGGYNDQTGTVLKSVDIMDLATKRWRTGNLAERKFPVEGCNPVIYYQTVQGCLCYV